MSNCQIAWGANYEPTLAMISQSFGMYKFFYIELFLVQDILHTRAINL